MMIKIIKQHEKFVTPYSGFLVQDPNWESDEQLEMFEKLAIEEPNLVFAFLEWAQDSEEHFVNPSIQNVLDKAGIECAGFDHLHLTCLASNFEEYKVYRFDGGPFSDDFYLGFAK